MSEIELDPELLVDFIAESRELLDDFSANLITLEQDPDDPDIIGAIFRAAHTLKGSSAFFNLVHIKNFAHKLENLLDEIRNKRRVASSEAIDYLLRGGEFLKNMFNQVQEGDFRTELTSNEEGFLLDLVGFIEKKPTAQAPESPEEILAVIQTLIAGYRGAPKTPELVIDEIEALLSEVGGKVLPEETVGPGQAEVGAPAHFFFQDFNLTAPLAKATATLDEAEKTGSLDAQALDEALVALVELIDAHGLEPLKSPMDTIMEDFRAIRDSGLDFDGLLIGILKEKLDAVIALVDRRVEQAPSPTAKPKAETEPEAKKPAGKKEEKTERKTMRIDEEKVDGFMNYVGELIVTSESFNYLQKLIENEKVNPKTLKAFKNANQAFRELSDDLQESLMEIRRVPIKGVLQKVNLLARDLSHQMGKQVKVHLEGQDIQLDKSIAESLEGPLVHVVRNALDHGLEPPDDRIAAGKPPESLLEVKAWADKEFFYLNVKDDGRGIDPEKIKQSALEKKVITEAQAAGLTDREAVNLVFQPGFSTAKEITDVSGRGVGMDVVRNNISQLNGVINLESAVGLGSTIALKIPLSVTLQVIKALLVRVKQQHFILSLDDILESLRPTPQEISTVEGRGEIINRRGKILPLVRLYEILNITPEFTEPADCIVVVMETSLGQYALMIDDVIGQQQVVVKEMDVQFKNLTFLAGSATLGDGRLGLVLDAEGLLNLARGGMSAAGPLPKTPLLTETPAVRPEGNNGG